MYAQGFPASAQVDTETRTDIIDDQGRIRRAAKLPHPPGEGGRRQFLVAGECVEVPTGAFDEDDVGAIAGRFAGFDIEKFAAAMVSTRERTFRVWHREESRFAPTHEDLAARFAALVGCLGGQMEAAEPVFARVYAAYAEAARHYHGLEHVIDCLREVDRVGAGPIVELALTNPVAYSSSTIGPADLPGALAQVRRDRLAVSRGEFKEGAIAVAVPVFSNGECAASLTIAGPSERCDSPEWVRRATRLLRVAATSMSQEIER